MNIYHSLNTKEVSETSDKLTFVDEELLKVNKEVLKTNEEVLKSWSEKILNQLLATSKYESDSKKVVKNDEIGTYLDKIDDLAVLAFCDFELWLASIEKKTYSKLSFQEKIDLIALDKTLKISNEFLGKKMLRNQHWKINVERFKVAHQNQVKNIYQSLTNNFKVKQVKNLLDTEKTLSEFGLTNKEIALFKLYLDNLKNEPELQQQSKFAPYLVIAALGIILGALGHAYYQKLFSSAPETLVKGGRIELWDLRRISKLFSTEVEVSTDGYIKKELFALDENDAIVKEFLKKSINKFQTHELAMDFLATVSAAFEVGGGAFYYDFEDKTIYGTLPYPSLYITNMEKKVTHRNNEVIGMKVFDNIQNELEGQTKERIIEDLQKNEVLLNTSMKHVSALILDLYKELIKSLGYEVNGIKINFIEWNTQDNEGGLREIDLNSDRPHISLPRDTVLEKK